MEKNLGHATAYGYAKSKGYSGTEEEFAELMADYATVGQSAAQSAEQAAASATSASGSATTASQAAQTATDKASEAVTAAGTATTKASEASQSASTASAAATSASTSAQTATTAATTATTKASEASESATTATTAKTDAETARDAAAQSASEAAESARTMTIDATLTQSGQAADAKATGDAITELKDDLNDPVLTNRIYAILERKGYNSAYGYASSTTRVSLAVPTKFPYAITLVWDSNCLVQWYSWSSTTMSENTHTGSSGGWLNNYCILQADTYYTFTIRKADNTEITLSEAQAALSISSKGSADNTLSIPFASADAKETGERIARIESNNENIEDKLYPYTADPYYKAYFKQKMLGIAVGIKVSNVDSDVRISTVDLLYTNSQIIIVADAGYSVKIVYCDSTNTCTSQSDYLSEVTVSSDSYFHISVRKVNDATISLNDLDHLHFTQDGFERFTETDNKIDAVKSDLNAIANLEEQDALYYGIVWPALWKTDFSSYTSAKIYGDRLYTYSSVYGRRAIFFSDVATDITEATYDSTNKVLTIAMPDESMLLLDPIMNKLSLQKNTTSKVPVDKIVVLYRYYNSYGGVFYDTHYVRQFESEVEKVIDEHVVLPKLVDQYAEQIGHVVGASDYYRSTSYVKDFTMLMISDTHEDNEEMSRAIEISEDVDAIDCIFNFGDIGGQTSAGQITSGKNYGVRFIEEANPTKPFFFTMGNHDEQHSATAEGNGTVEYGVSTIIPFLNTAEHYNARGYGYYDYDNYKVRIIMLNCFDYPDTVVNGNFVYYEDYICWQEAQVQFFISTLASVPDDYTVVVCSHYCEEGNVDNSIINQHCPSSKLSRTDATKVGTKTYMSGLVMSDIINAYKNKTTVSGTYSYSNGGMSTSYSISADFSTAKGTFAIWLCGHRHQSCVAHSVIGNYLIYANDTSDCGNIDSVWATYNSNQPRSKGNNTRDLMTCFSIDTGNMKIKLTRIGAHVNRFLDDENLLLLSYAPTQGT